MVKEDQEKSKRQLTSDMKETQSLAFRDSDQNFFFFFFSSCSTLPQALAFPFPPYFCHSSHLSLNVLVLYGKLEHILKTVFLQNSMCNSACARKLHKGLEDNENHWVIFQSQPGQCSFFSASGNRWIDVADISSTFT